MSAPGQGEPARARGSARPAPATPFAGLTPDAVLTAAESIGLVPDGHLFALNSYENRVYRVGREDAEPVVLKFYRAGRWSDAQILEEHAFATELAAAELPVVAPLRLQGATLHAHGSFRLAAFPLAAGAAPQLDRPGALELLGRTLARVHAVGSRSSFQVRPALEGERLGATARRALLASPLLPDYLHERYAQVSAALLEALDAAFAAAGSLGRIRLHGDCHLGNILWQPTGPLFVDLDDCLNGPRIQDLWMFLSGSPAEQASQWAELSAGYEMFGHLPPAELGLIEALRAARMLNHAGWVAERWADPAFPRAFPWAAEPRFWEGYLVDLAGQIAAVREPPPLWE